MSKHKQARHPFEEALAVCSEDLRNVLRNFPALPWLDFWLNPRRLRGSDFLMRWSQGVWSEQRLIEAVNDTGEFFAIPYGPSGTAPTGSVREFELYFERLEAAGLGKIKRPDVLIFSHTNKKRAEDKISLAGGSAELPFIPETDSRIASILKDAILGVECENSLWRSEKMPDFQTPLRPQRRLGGKPGLKKGAVLPNIIIKEEDRQPLKQWQKKHGIPIHVWHVFYDRAYGLSLDRSETHQRKPDRSDGANLSGSRWSNDQESHLQALLPLRLFARSQHGRTETSSRVY
jgi:hypothetical protein